MKYIKTYETIDSELGDFSVFLVNFIESKTNLYL